MDGHQRQKEQSKKMIRDALFELMEKKSFEQITVSEIVKRADVARRTFYRLYEGKLDVLHSCFDELYREYCSRYEPLEYYDVGRIAREYFGFWYLHREFLLRMQKCGSEDVLYCELNRGAMEVIKQRIGSSRQRFDSEEKYFITYSAGGFINLLHSWIMDGMRGTPEEYAQNVTESLLKFIPAGREPGREARPHV